MMIRLILSPWTKFIIMSFDSTCEGENSLKIAHALLHHILLFDHSLTIFRMFFCGTDLKVGVISSTFTIKIII